MFLESKLVTTATQHPSLEKAIIDGSLLATAPGGEEDPASIIAGSIFAGPNGVDEGSSDQTSAWMPTVGSRCNAKWLSEEGENGIWWPGTVKVVEVGAQLCSVWFDDEILEENLPWHMTKAL